MSLKKLAKPCGYRDNVPAPKMLIPTIIIQININITSKCHVSVTMAVHRR